MYFCTALRCNGHQDFCELRFDQVTFPGSHSSGSGFNGELRNCEGIVGSQCLFRNHLLSITGQLDLGVRFLNLDVCHLSINCSDEAYGDLSTSRLVSCQGGDDMLFQGFKYGGRVIDIFNQVEDWMRNNTEEVIGLHFTRNTPSDERDEVFSGLVQLLDLMWGEQSSSTGLNSFYTTNNLWPTLKQAVESNQRIFVFFDEELIVNGTIMRSWINPPPSSTFQESPFNPSCMNPGILDHASRCDTTNDIVIAAGYTVAVCITNAQAACNYILLDAMEMCFSIRREENRTVNVILVDYPEMTTNNVSVFSVAMVLNEMNVRNILNERSTEITSGERSTEGVRSTETVEITSGERSTGGERSTETTPGERSTETEWSTEITPGERSSEGERSTENTTGERSTENTTGERSTENTTGERSTENTTGERSTETTPGERSSEGERYTPGEMSTPGERSSEGERSTENTPDERSTEIILTEGERSTETTPGKMPTEGERSTEITTNDETISVHSRKNAANSAYSNIIFSVAHIIIIIIHV